MPSQSRYTRQSRRNDAWLEPCSVGGMAARAIVGFLATVVLLVAATQCGGESAGVGGDGGKPGNQPIPTNHRPAAPACPSDRPPGVNIDGGVLDGGVNECVHDSDCTMGKNGRCLPSGGNRAGNICSYDACNMDSDCPSGQLCQCGQAGGMYGRYGNSCIPSNCRVDSDCGANGYCSPTYDTTCGSRNGVVGYYCHTPGDDCVNDDQCTEAGIGYCAWQPTTSKWSCSYGVCSG
jgi:hypothetical protein